MEYLMRTPNGEFRHGYSLFAGKGKELRGFSNMSPLLLLPFYFTPVFTPEQLGDIRQVIDIYENNQDEIQDGEMIDEGEYYLLYSTVDRLDDLAFSFLDSYLVNGRSVGIDISAYRSLAQGLCLPPPFSPAAWPSLPLAIAATKARGSHLPASSLI